MKVKFEGVYLYVFCVVLAVKTNLPQQNYFILYILVVYVSSYIVGILWRAKEEFHWTEKHASLLCI